MSDSIFVMHQCVSDKCYDLKMDIVKPMKLIRVTVTPMDYRTPPTDQVSLELVCADCDARTRIHGVPDEVEVVVVDRT